jgi:hypothetical protein
MREKHMLFSDWSLTTIIQCIMTHKTMLTFLCRLSEKNASLTQMKN